MLDSPKYVEWVAHMVQSTGTADSETKIEIGTHLCTLEEWNAFYEPDERIKSNFLKMR